MTNELTRINWEITGERPEDEVLQADVKRKIPLIAAKYMCNYLKKPKVNLPYFMDFYA